MKITRRSPRIRIGNTTYTFGKTGVSRSTKIAKGVRIRTSANGHQSVGGSFLFWRWSQDLDELGRKKSPDEIKQIREQRKNELSPWLLMAHPIVFFDHLLRRKSNPAPIPMQQGGLPQNQGTQLPQNTNPAPVQPKAPPTSIFSSEVSIFKETNGILTKVTEGTAILESDKITVKANVTKEISYKDILDVYIEKGKIFISSKNRNIPLVLQTNNVEIFMNELNGKIMEGR